MIVEGVHDIIPEFRIPKMPPVNLPAKEDCEHCGKNNVCKYRGHVEKVKEYIKTRYDDGWDQLPIKIDVKCKEFSIGYTGVR